MLVRLWVVAAISVGIAGACLPAAAMRFGTVDVGQSVIITANGDIEPNDTRAFAEAVKDIPPERSLLGLSIDSPGGNLLEAEKFAALIHDAHVPVAVVSGSMCASACFLLFTASPQKFATPDALIGVHSASASEGGDENLTTLGVTTAVARDAAGYGVPPEIVGRMVTTQPGQIAWLTGKELAQMGVSFLTATAPAPTYTPGPNVAVLPAPATMAPPAGVYAGATGLLISPPHSPLFDQGLADRRAWEQWFSSLVGDQKAGAEYWSGQRSLPKPGSCYRAASSGQDENAFASGCLAAKQRLAHSDQMRKNPDYKAGWNSF